MSLIGPLFGDLEDYSPRGYTYFGEKCQCSCHDSPNVKHIMACCFMFPPDEEQVNLLEE